MQLADALEVVSVTDPGRVRSHNEDAVFADAGIGFAVLADGMGGYNAGEIASGMATAVLASSFSRFIPLWQSERVVPGIDFCETHLRQEIEAANLAIYNAAQSQPQYSGMGTTLVAAWCHDNRLTFAHVGDSRLYLWRDGRLQQLTRDHSFLQEQIDSGVLSAAEARHAQHRNLVTRALGVEPVVKVDVAEIGVQVGDGLLLCSDGLTDMLDDQEIALALQVFGQQPDLAATQLVELANAAGGRDNISVILLRVRRDFAQGATWWQRWLSKWLG